MSVNLVNESKSKSCSNLLQRGSINNKGSSVLVLTPPESCELPLPEVKKTKKINFSKTPEKVSLKSGVSVTSLSHKGSGSVLNFSYVVLIASFFAYMLASMLATCFGVFFESMESDLGWPRSKVALIGGVLSAIQDLTGPISSMLTNKYGCRKTAFCGGIIASLGIIGSAYVDTYWLFGFLMGGVSGFGSSLVLVSSVVVVTYYFEEKPSFAAGLTISGGSLGQSIFSMIIIQLNEYYGRSGCFLILGGILLNICVCAALYRPLQWELEDEDDSLEDESEDEDEDESENNDDDDDDEDEVETTTSHLLTKKTSAAPVASQELNNYSVSSTVDKLDQLEFFCKVRPLKISSSDSCLTKINNVKSSHASLNKSRRSARKYEISSNPTITMNRCVSLRSSEHKSMQQNTTFFSDPSTLHVVPKDFQQVEEEYDDSFKSYLFINSLYHELAKEAEAEAQAEIGDNTTWQNDINTDSSINNTQAPLLEPSNGLIHAKAIEDKNVNAAKSSKIVKFFHDKFKNFSQQSKKDNAQDIATINTATTTITVPLVQSALTTIVNANPHTLTNKQAKLFINKCNCKQRHIQNINRRLLMKSSQTTPTSTTAGTIMTTTTTPTNNTHLSVNNGGGRIKLDIIKLYNIKGFRHFSNCPLFYLKNLNEDSFVHQSHNIHHQHHHHHHQNNHGPNNLTPSNYQYVPSLFQNSYRIPLHYKNVYYYKSLVNLNMRLMASKRNKVLTLKSESIIDLNSISLSCPDLNMTNSNLNKIEKVSNKRPSKILNAGSLLLLADENKPNKATLDLKGIKVKQKSEKKSVNDIIDLNSLSEEYTDKIGENESKNALMNDDEDDDDEDEDHAKYSPSTKIGKFFYKYIYKPTFTPIKLLGYSIMENLKLFCIFKFCIFALCNFVLSFFYEAPFYFINSYMVKNGLSTYQAGTVHVGVGITSVLASILYGYFGDSKKVNQIVLYSVSLILCGVCSCLIPLFIQNYLITMFLMIMIGALISVSDVLVPTICVSIVGYDDFVNAYGMMFFCQGLASLSGPPTLGMLVDYFQDYSYAYYVIGVGIAISGFILTSILCFNTIESIKKNKNKKLNSNDLHSIL